MTKTRFPARQGDAVASPIGVGNDRNNIEIIRYTPTQALPHFKKGGRELFIYSSIVSPEPPASFGRSLNFGRPSFIGSTVSS